MESNAHETFDLLAWGIEAQPPDQPGGQVRYQVFATDLTFKPFPDSANIFSA